MTKQTTMVVTGSLRVNLYHTLGEFSRRQIDVIYLFLFFFFYVFQKICFDISYQLSLIRVKCQGPFFAKYISKMSFAEMFTKHATR